MEETEESNRAIDGQDIWSWGAGTEGQLGTGKPEDEHLPQLLHLPCLSAAGGPISHLTCGGSHVVALTSGGKVLTWGRGTSGQLGHGDMVNSLHPKSVAFFENYCVSHVAAGWNHSGFVSDTGGVFTCGDGSFGQLGHGDYSSHSSPVKVSYFDSKNVAQIACGMRHSLVLLRDSSGDQVYGFGSGKRGQLGISQNKVGLVNLPHMTLGIEHLKMVSITANGDHSAALSDDGHLYTWGRGFGGGSDAYNPQCLPSSLRFTKVALGWNHALLLTTDGLVFMLGGKRHGVLSDPEKTRSAKQIDSRELVLESVPNLGGTEVLQIASGAEHSALVTEARVIKTWGWGEHGQLGLGSTDDQTSPQTVNLGQEDLNEDGTFEIYCGSGFTYAVRTPCSPPET